MLVSVSLSNSTFIENMWSTLCIHLNLIQCSMLKRTYCVCVCEWVRIFGKWLENLPKPNISINFNYSIKHPSMGRFMFTYLHRNGELVEKVDMGQCSNDTYTKCAVPVSSSTNQFAFIEFAKVFKNLVKFRFFILFNFWTCLFVRPYQPKLLLIVT